MLPWCILAETGDIWQKFPFDECLDKMPIKM